MDPNRSLIIALLSFTGCAWLIAAHGVAFRRTRSRIYAYSAAIWLFYAGYVAFQALTASASASSELLAAPIIGALVIMLIAPVASERYPGYPNSRALLLFAQPRPANQPTQTGGLFVPSLRPQVRSQLVKVALGAALALVIVLAVLLS